MGGLTFPVTPALVLRLIVDVLTRVVGDVRHPIRQAWQLFRDAGADVEVLTRETASSWVCLAAAIARSRSRPDTSFPPPQLASTSTAVAIATVTGVRSTSSSIAS